MALRIQIFKTGTIREITRHLQRCKPAARCALGHPGSLLHYQAAQIATLAARHAVPTSFPARDYVERRTDELRPDINDAFRQAGVYTGRVPKGAKVADLPVVQSSELELVINAQTALLLGLEVPPTLLARADEVIE